MPCCMKQKKTWLWLVVLFVLLGAVGSYLLLRPVAPKVNPELAQVVGEYEGMVDFREVFGENEAYRVGSNSVGKPVFADLEAAWDQMLLDYSDALAAVEEQFVHHPIDEYNWKLFETYSWQLDESCFGHEIQQEGVQLSQFLGVYANSFDDYGNAT